MSSKPTVSATIAVALIACPPLFGGTLELESQASTTVSYNDNPLLRPSESDPDSTASAVLDYQLKVSQSSANTDLTFTPRISRLEYPSGKFSDLSATEYRLNADLTQSYGLIEAGGQLSATNLTVLTAEDSDPESPIADSTGNFLSRNERVENISVSPYLTWTMSELDLITFSAFGARVDRTTRFGPRADYNVRQGSIRYQRALSPRQFIGLTVSGSRSDTIRKHQYCQLVFPQQRPVAECQGFTTSEGFRSEWYIVTGEERQDIETYDVGLTYEYKVSDELSLSARYGEQRTDIETRRAERQKRASFIRNDPDFVQRQALSSDFTSSTYLFSVDYSRPRSTWLLEISRDVQPSSEGSPADKTEVRGIARYRITERLAVKLATLYYKQVLRSPGVFSKNKVLRADLSLAWNLTRNLSAISTYIYRNRDPQITVTNLNFAAANRDRTSHNMLFTLRYRF